MYDYCSSNDLLTWRNSGFKYLDSTVNQLLYIVHKIYASLELNHDVLMVFLDVAKAFDKVYHRGLLHKLHSLGIDGNLLNWFESYLHGRYQRVVINGRNSEWKPITAGVPQGSILGPLLFLIFVNDIVDDLECDPFLFADDTSLFQCLENDMSVTAINRDLLAISSWAAQWRVTFNAAKTVYMIFSKKINRPAPVAVMLDGIPVNRVSTHCHLGVHFSDNLSWETHISAICKRASGGVNLLKRMNNRIISRKTKLTIYKSFIRPRLEYANVIFGINLTKGQIDSMENIQRQALLCCCGAYQHTSHTKLLHEVGIEPLLI